MAPIDSARFIHESLYGADAYTVCLLRMGDIMNNSFWSNRNLSDLKHLDGQFVKIVFN